MSDVENDPVKKGTKQISYQALLLHQGESKVVFVVTKDSVEILISIVFVVYGVVQDLQRTQNDCVEEIVTVKVWDSSTKTTRDHVGDYNHYCDEGLVDKCLNCLTQPQLNLIAVLEQKVAHG